MGNPGNRGSHEAEICRQIMAADPAWERDPYLVESGPANLARLGIKPVSDGETDRGRGSTAWDLYRARNEGGVICLDALQVKTGKIKSSGSVPSEVLLATGNKVAPAIIDAILEKNTRWDLLFVAGDTTSPVVRILMLDIGEKIRQAQDSIGVHKPGDRAADPFFVKLSDTRVSGAYANEVRLWEAGKAPLPPGKSWEKRAHLSFPAAEDCFEFRGEEIPGRVWESPVRVRYAQLCVSLYRLGVTQRDWRVVARADLPKLVADYDFGYGL